MYSALANLRARGYQDDKWIYEIAQLLPKPDLTFFLETDFDEAMRRVRSREEERARYINIDFQKELWRQFKYVSDNTDCIVLKSDENINELSEVIMNLVKRTILKKGLDRCL